MTTNMTMTVTILIDIFLRPARLVCSPQSRLKPYLWLSPPTTLKQLRLSPLFHTPATRFSKPHPNPIMVTFGSFSSPFPLSLYPSPLEIASIRDLQDPHSLLWHIQFRHLHHKQPLHSSRVYHGPLPRPLLPYHSNDPDSRGLFRLLCLCNIHYCCYV